MAQKPAGPVRDYLRRSNRQLKAGPIILRVATPEDFLILKAVAHRQRDLIDIDNLLAVHENLDLDRNRHWVRQFAELLDLPELIRDLEKLLESRSDRG